MYRGAIDAVRCFDEIFWLCEVDVRDERLGIAVYEREPGALNLHHQTMSFLETMQDIE